VRACACVCPTYFKHTGLNGVWRSGHKTKAKIQSHHATQLIRNISHKHKHARVTWRRHWRTRLLSDKLRPFIEPKRTHKNNKYIKYNTFVTVAENNEGTLIRDTWLIKHLSLQQSTYYN